MIVRRNLVEPGAEEVEPSVFKPDTTANMTGKAPTAAIVKPGRPGWLGVTTAKLLVRPMQNG